MAGCLAVMSAPEAMALGQRLKTPIRGLAECSDCCSTSSAAWARRQKHHDPPHNLVVANRGLEIVAVLVSCVRGLFGPGEI